MPCRICFICRESIEEDEPIRYVGQTRVHFVCLRELKRELEKVE